MKIYAKTCLALVLVTIALCSCEPSVTYDMAIHNVKIFNSETKEVLNDQTILISDGRISDIIDKHKPFTASTTIDGNGRLVTPGLVDTHIHLGNLYGTYDEAPEYLVKDSIASYKRKLAETYLAHGVTSIATMGNPEKWTEEAIKWQESNSSDLPNLSVTGSAIISDDERPPYVGHVEVMNPEDARKKVRQYHDMGARHLKLYWRLRQPEMEAVIAEANALGLNMFAHSDNEVVPISTVLDLGVKNLEHAMTTNIAPFVPELHDPALNAIIAEHYGQLQAVLHYMLERIQFIEDTPDLKQQRDALLQRMVDEKATLSTTIHLFGSIAKRTYFNTYIDNYYNDQNPDMTEAQLKRLSKAFDTFMAYIKDAHDRGLKLRLGTDCEDGGQAALSEILLLHEAGIPMVDVLQIATLNGAEALQIQDDTGNVTVGKQADLIIFKNNPLDNPNHIKGKKTVIRAGKIYQ